MAFQVLKHVRKYAAEAINSENRGLIDEYLYIVSYHLDFALNAAQQCGSELSNPLLGNSGQISIDPVDSAAYIFDFSVEAIVRYGDTAIREALSAIDAGLLLTNYIVETGIEQHRLSWKHQNKKRSLKIHLETSPDAHVRFLHNAIQAVIDSIGYELLGDYRNWVTHRGAPRIQTELQLPGPIPVPPNILDNTDLDKERWHLTNYLRTEVPRHIYVQCVPFYPLLTMIYNAKIKGASGAIELPGNVLVDVEEGSSISFQNIKVDTGSLLETREQLARQQKVTPELSRVEVAGEMLVTYRVSDYVQGVSRLTRFVQEALSGEWDKQLAAFCRARRSLTDES